MQRPDFSVVQIALQALCGDGRRMAALRHWLATTRVVQVRRMAVALGHELNRLMDATDPSENNMFLNVVGGAAESEVLAVVTKELAEAGVESTIALGPLLMKTNGTETAARGGQSIVLPMPILVASTTRSCRRRRAKITRSWQRAETTQRWCWGKGERSRRSDTTRGEGWPARWQQRHLREENARRQISTRISDGC